MKKIVCGLLAGAIVICANGLTAPGAHATGSRLHRSASMPKTTLLGRSFRWKWDPFRVEGDKAYAVALIKNFHDYAVTLKTYCKVDDTLIPALSGRHLIEPGRTLRWDTRSLLRKAGRNIDAVVTCRFWIDGSVDLQGKIVSHMPARMGDREDTPVSVITFHYPNFGPKG